MTRRIQTNPRKTALQERSRLTVDALLEATARILIKEGFDVASTNRIAEVAGVSVGSLYQYFPSKEALVAALIDRHNRSVMELVQDGLLAAVNLPIAQAIPQFVALALKAHRVDPKLHRVLSEQIPRVGRLEKFEGFNRQYYTLFRAYLEGRRGEIRSLDLELAAFVCVTTVEALTHNAVLHHKMVSDEQLAALIQEGTRLIVGYLTNNG